MQDDKTGTVDDPKDEKPEAPILEQPPAGDPKKPAEPPQPGELPPPPAPIAPEADGT